MALPAGGHSQNPCKSVDTVFRFLKTHFNLGASGGMNGEYTVKEGFEPILRKRCGNVRISDNEGKKIRTMVGTFCALQSCDEMMR
ncbi:hypothetical protein SAMN05216233_102210 [Desulfoluna spongiiphila]|uniref:Uncharacterized protein n=1 Tax=Desulfoluna spongiiphila TaxID=419481 RepID=A0A1G5BUT9_9BACT|nr:hypothetical protein SAMN05216233_102210 [Desulfoluna spongiiphila]